MKSAFVKVASFAVIFALALVGCSDPSKLDAGQGDQVHAFGAGGPGFTQNRPNDAIMRVSSDPDGVLTAPRGTLAVNSSTGEVYQNTNGGTSWRAMMMTSFRWQAGHYYVPVTGTLATSSTLGADTLRALPFYVPNRITITKIGADISAAGDAASKLRLGIYNDDGYGSPSTLIIDAGTINGNSATVQEITGLSVTIGPGWYWQAAAVQVVTTTSPTVRVINSAIPGSCDYGTALPSASQVLTGVSRTGVTGALPATFSPTAYVGSAARLIFGT